MAAKVRRKPLRKHMARSTDCRRVCFQRSIVYRKIQIISYTNRIHTRMIYMYNVECTHVRHHCKKDATQSSSQTSRAQLLCHPLFDDQIHVVFRSDMLELRPLQKSTTQNWTLMTWRSMFVWLLHGSDLCHWRLGNSRGIYKVGEALRDEITPGKPIYFRPFIGSIITPFNNVPKGAHLVITPKMPFAIKDRKRGFTI